MERMVIYKLSITLIALKDYINHSINHNFPHKKHSQYDFQHLILKADMKENSSFNGKFLLIISQVAAQHVIWIAL